MTETERAPLEAGVELDAFIARAVFGLVPCSDPAGRCEGARSNPITCWGTGQEGSGLRSYSTDIAAAWAVVERLIRDLGYGVTLCYYDRDVIEVTVTTHRLAPPHIRSFAPTAPLAICRAALRALREEEPTA